MKGETVGANGHLNPEASVSRTIDRRRRRAARTMVGLALVSSVVMTTYSPIDTAFAATTFTVNSTIDAVDTNPGDGSVQHGRRLVLVARRHPGGERPQPVPTRST